MSLHVIDDLFETGREVRRLCKQIAGHDAELANQIRRAWVRAAMKRRRRTASPRRQGLKWRVWFHNVDMGLVEIVPASLEHFVPEEPNLSKQPRGRHDARHSVNTRGVHRTSEPKRRSRNNQ